jgi:hypothetical protein
MPVKTIVTPKGIRREQFNNASFVFEVPSNVSADQITDGEITDAKIASSGGLGTYLATRAANLPSSGAFDNALVQLPRFIPTWDPSWDSTCVAWYFVDENVTRVAGAASVIPNRVRNGVDPLIQTTMGSRPTYEAAGWMGQPSILLDGTDDYMTADGLSGYASGNDLAWSVAMAIQPPSLPASLGTIFSFGRSTLDTAYHQVYMDSGGNFDVFRHDDSAGSQLRQAALTAAKQIVVVIFTGTTLSVLVNDTALLSASVMNVGTMTVDRFTVGALGRSAYQSFGYLRMREMVMFNRALVVRSETTRLYNNLVARSPTF